MRFVRRTYGKAQETEGNGASGTAISYNDLLGYALSVLGLYRDDFDWMTPVEFNACIEAFNKNSDKNIRYRYEVSRFNAWLNLAPYLKSKSQEELIKFPWEEIKMGKIKGWQDQRNTKN